MSPRGPDIGEGSLTLLQTFPAFHGEQGTKKGCLPCRNIGSLLISITGLQSHPNRTHSKTCNVLVVLLPSIHSIAIYCILWNVLGIQVHGSEQEGGMHLLTCFSVGERGVEQETHFQSWEKISMENNRVQRIRDDGGAKEGRLSSGVPITNLKGKEWVWKGKGSQLVLSMRKECGWGAEGKEEAR